MATTYELIAQNVLGSSALSVTFSSIPQTFDDLLLKVSARSNGSADGSPWVTASIRFNGTTTGYTGRSVYGLGSSVGSNTDNSGLLIPDPEVTSNVFGSSESWIPNYTSSANKSVSTTSVTENNAVSAAIWGHALLWSNTSAITSLTLTPIAGSFITGSSFFLYGITKA